MVSGQAAIELFSQIMMRSITCLLVGFNALFIKLYNFVTVYNVEYLMSTCMLLQKSCEERILANYDAISLYLCICLCAKYSELMVERGIPAMDGYVFQHFLILFRGCKKITTMLGNKFVRK